ncbi:MAG: porin family protein [Acidobacteriia bacterium]|nr:porin family protein [Terriglobia bacterium]
MRKFIGFALLFGMFSLAALAQESAPKAEFFGGYQYTRFDGGLNANGWDTTLTGNLNHWFGVAADFSGAYKSQNGVSFNNYTYTFGPVVSLRRNENFTPFAHFLAGGFHSSAAMSGLSVGGGGFAMMLGGGVDVKVTQRVAVRAIQFDWLSLHANGGSDNNNARISTGLLFRY